MKIGYIRVSTQEQNTMRQEVLVESISRFARNTKDLLELVEQLTAKGVEFISQKEAIDTSTSTGKFMLTIFGAVAELEREYILQRQREGIAIAKEQGKYTGRPMKTPPDFEKIVRQWRQGEMTAIEARKRLGISKAEAFEKLSELMSALRAVGSSYFIQWTQTRGSRCASVEGH